MAEDFTPRVWQPPMLQAITQWERCNVWARMGSGKTGATLVALDALTLTADPFPALVLAPLRVARSTWPKEVAKWSQTKHLRVAAATESESQRSHLVHARHADIVTINYDKLPWLVEHLGALWPFRTVIADESTRLKSFRLKQGGVRAQALGKVAHKRVRRWVNLTGTPSPNGLRDLWGQQWFIDEGRRLGRSFEAFENRWFAYKRASDINAKNKHEVEMVVMPFAQRQIEEALADCTVTIDPRDYVEMPPLIEQVVEVDMPAGARRHYRELEREMFTVLAGGHEVEAVTAAAKSQKCLQCANGALYLDPSVENDEDPRARAFQVLHDEKIEALRSIVEEAGGMPVLVAYQFKSDLARLLKAFPRGRHLDADPSTEDRWNEGKIPLLFAHPASAGHGLNLQFGGNIIVFFGLWWNLEEHEQIIERVGPTRQMQAGLSRPTYVYRIVTRGTVDELVLRRLETKASVQSLLLEAMKEQR